MTLNHVLTPREDRERLARERRSTEQREKIRAQARQPELQARAEEVARREQARQIEQQRREFAEREKQELGRPITKHTGLNNPRPLVVTHWKLKSPLAFLPPASSRTALISNTEVMLRKRPELRNDDVFLKQAESAEELYNDVVKRYGTLLVRLRTNWWGQLCGAASVTMSATNDQPWRGNYAAGTRKVTVVNVPVLIGVKVGQDGLRLRVQHRAGDSAKNWNGKIDTLRAGLKAAGVDASQLSIAEDKSGNIVLALHDVDPFHNVPCGVALFDAEHGRSLLGVTSKGHEAWIDWRGNSGMVIGGVPGSGKTASLMPVFAGMADKAELHVFDGKALYDLHPLRHIAATYDRSGDLTAPLKTLRALEALRVQRGEALYSKLGANNFWNISQAQRDQLGMRHVFVILDEAQTWLDVGGQLNKEDKAVGAEIFMLARTLVQKGRASGITVVFTTQKPDSTSIPTIIRDNAALKICFRVSTPEQATTVLGKQGVDAPDPTRIPMSARGRFVMETEGHGIVLGQAGYMPNDELDAYLAEHKPVEDQAEVAARLLGDAPKPSGPITTEELGSVQRLTPEQVKAEAIRLGLIPADEAPANVPEELVEPRTAQSKATSAPKIEGEF